MLRLPHVEVRMALPIPAISGCCQMSRMLAVLFNYSRNISAGVFLLNFVMGLEPLVERLELRPPDFLRFFFV